MFDSVLVFQPREETVCAELTVMEDDIASTSDVIDFRVSGYESGGAKVMIIPTLLSVSIANNDGT